MERLQLTPDVIATMRAQVAAHLDQRLKVEREAHARVKKELAALDGKEERLLDLAADGTLTTGKVQDRLRNLQVQRATLTQRLSTTAEVIQQESDTLLRYLDLLERTGAFYAAASDTVKRRLLRAYFAQIWIDDDGHLLTPDTQQQALVAQITAAAHRSAAHENGTEQVLGAADSLPNTVLYQRVGSSKVNVVPGKGLQKRHVALRRIVRFGAYVCAILTRPSQRNLVVYGHVWMHS
ncbi:MAG: hypothetical protein QM753_03390 [Thermomicrobiales bacterium]